MRVFLDTNVVLDLLLQREGYQHPARLMQLHEDGKITLCQSALSLANIAYILRKCFSPGVLAPTLKQLSCVSEILPLDEQVFEDAVLLEGPDFEDILQLVCASRNGCDIVITRNVKHFNISAQPSNPFKKPEIMTPEEYLLNYR